MFLVPINIQTFHFSSSIFFFRFLVPKKKFIVAFGTSFQINSYVQFIFFNKKNYQCFMFCEYGSGGRNYFTKFI